MPSFHCQTCDASFDVAQSALDKYPGWTPKFCRAHSKKAKAKSGSTRRPGSKRAASREENLSGDEVLARYTAGPTTGVFTDGSANPNPGPGGWGVVWVEDGELRAEQSGHDPQTTNNRMELKALIEAYKLLPADAAVKLYSDSRLCVDTLTRWAAGWEKRGWTRKAGPIKNLDLVQEAWALYQARPKCRLEWVKAHSGQRWNEYADSLASAWERGRR